ncbi:unnamed protein product [Caenorhabditis auriculariae]|uniref:Uncharacterized protein n=1 Tax=Caenorhabditis auriculariae TaxID=2777116 RepID=A0A8S1HA41_9PELO|nr:unnamed protein product [Caenorhabditis auriculariae]
MMLKVKEQRNGEYLSMAEDIMKKAEVDPSYKRPPDEPWHVCMSDEASPSPSSFLHDVQEIVRRQNNSSSTPQLRELAVLPPIHPKSRRRFYQTTAVPNVISKNQLLLGLWGPRRRFFRRHRRSATECLDTPDLQVELDSCTIEEVQRIVDILRSFAAPLISVEIVLSSIKEVLPASGDGWKNMLKLLSPSGGSIDVHAFATALVDEKISRDAAVTMITLPEELNLNAESIIPTLASRVTSSQERRGRNRAQLMTDLEVIIARNPHLDIDRFVSSTAKKVIDEEEFTTLLQLYGFEEQFRACKRRIVKAFRTHDKLFHFSAFVQCLGRLRPQILRQPLPFIQHNAVWLKPALPAINPKSATSENRS